MAAVSWFANSANLTLTGVTIAALKGVTIEPKYEMVELFGMEDTERAAIARHSLKVPITVKYAKWDASADTLFTSVIGVAGTSTATNRNIAPVFTMTASFRSSDGSQYQTYTVTDVVFDGVPINMSENEFVTRDLSGTGAMATATGGSA
jgi:hypothetical protein